MIRFDQRSTPLIPADDQMRGGLHVKGQASD